MERINYIHLFYKFTKKKATKEEVCLLIQWLKEDSSFFSWGDKQWKTVSSDMDKDLQQKLFKQVKSEIKPQATITKVLPLKPSDIFSQWIMHVAVVVLLFLTTGLAISLYTSQQTSVSDMIVSVDRGQKANITLPDGSKVWINSGSRLSYGSRFNHQERVLHLDGEAYFEVTPDKGRPFIVETNDISIKALGTSFNVKSYADENCVFAVLMTGKVEVQTKQSKEILYPNEQAIIDRCTGTMYKKELKEASIYSDWRYNSLHFDGETFANIVLMLERLYNTSIIFQSEELKKYRFTGTLGNTSLDSILEILSLTSPLSYSVENGQILLDENEEKRKKYERVFK